jgi:hypothetical protein
MRVFRLETSDGYQRITYQPDSRPAFDADVLHVPFARSMRGRWIPPKMRLIELDQRRRRLPVSDYPKYLPGVPILSVRAVDALRDLIEPRGEILPIASDKDKWFFFNTTCVIDALDVDRSVVDVSDVDGRIMFVEQHVFKPNVLDDAVIFKLPQLTYSRVYVTPLFAERVRSVGLVGFDFRLVWNSDDERQASE